MQCFFCENKYFFLNKPGLAWLPHEFFDLEVLYYSLALWDVAFQL